MWAFSEKKRKNPCGLGFKKRKKKEKKKIFANPVNNQQNFPRGLLVCSISELFWREGSQSVGYWMWLTVTEHSHLVPYFASWHLNEFNSYYSIL